MKNDFHAKGCSIPNPVDKQKLADARFDLDFQTFLYRIINTMDCQGGQ